MIVNSPASVIVDIKNSQGEYASTLLPFALNISDKEMGRIQYLSVKTDGDNTAPIKLFADFCTSVQSGDVPRDPNFLTIAQPGSEFTVRRFAPLRGLYTKMSFRACTVDREPLQITDLLMHVIFE
jgi:hypothetical protein